MSSSSLLRKSHIVLHALWSKERAKAWLRNAHGCVRALVFLYHLPAIARKYVQVWGLDLILVDGNKRHLQGAR
jgi:hypothetical protein